MKKIFSILISLVFLSAYSNINFPTSLDDDYNSRLSHQPEIAEIIEIPDNLTLEETKALKYIYTYMPTPDILNYPKYFFIENIWNSLKAKKEMSWGDSVPDREWLHFVLPLRVNNESLDNSRNYFFNELKERVKGMSMKDAILETNHWCHEKVSYQPSDMRTSPPLTTMKNASGRCGEESTFTVAALRSIGIPARQVYTTRWAHTDDNHAWVEAWADGKWWFLGACEPEPELNMAWFNEPASRGMLMTTDVIGRYDGPEEKSDKTEIGVTINVTENYAPVKESVVTVIDEKDLPVKDAIVKFCLYNYAEFYPIGEKGSDKSGKAKFISGAGDLLVWAAKEGKFNFTPIHAGDSIILRLDKDNSFSGILEFDNIPPKGNYQNLNISPEKIKNNESRKVFEDSIRNNYIATFPSPADAKEICKSLNLDEIGVDSIASDIIVKSRGNHKVILSYLSEIPLERREFAIKLLSVLPEKDLHDISTDILTDNLLYTPLPQYPTKNISESDYADIYAKYILNPRIYFENLTPYKEYFQKALSKDEIDAYKKSPALLAEKIGEIRDYSGFNPKTLTQSPRATFEYKVGDDLNKTLLFVAICRSIGVPARINEITGETQFLDFSGDWKAVNFISTNDIKEEEEVELFINNPDSTFRPEYYKHFTLSKIEHGIPQLLEYEDFESIDNLNAKHYNLPKGQYLLTSGRRMASGDVLCRLEVLHLNGNENPNLIVRQDTTKLSVIGNLNSENLYIPITFFPQEEKALGSSNIILNEDKSLLSTTGRGFFVLGFIKPAHEPSVHTLNDIILASEELDSCGRKILLLFENEDDAKRFNISEFNGLTENVCFGIDSHGILEELSESINLSQSELSNRPIFVIADTFNRVVFKSVGYTIHLGSKLVEALHQCE